MAGVDLSIVDAILKEDYLGPIREEVNLATPVLPRIETNSRDIVGREAVIPFRMELPQGAGARAEKAILPPATSSVYKEARVPLTYYYGVIEATGQSIRQTNKGDKGSFGRTTELEMKGIKDLLKLLTAHDVYLGDNLGDTIVDGVNDPDLIVTLGTQANMEYFFVGMRVDVLNAAFVTIADSAVIASVDKAAKTVTVTGVAAFTTIAGGRIVREDTFGVSLNGLFDLIGTGTLYGIDPVLFPRWQSTVNATFGAFTDVKLQTLLDDIRTASGKSPTAIYSNYPLQRTYWQSLVANPRYQTGTVPQKLAGGFKMLEYVGGAEPIPWIADHLMPFQSLLLPHEPDLQFFAPGDWDWIEGSSGNVWSADIIGATKKDTFSAVIQRDMQLGIYSRNSSGKALLVT